jgi:hypothetical protein
MAKLKESVVQQFSLGEFRKNFKGILRKVKHDQPSGKNAFKEVKLVS